VPRVTRHFPQRPGPPAGSAGSAGRAGRASGVVAALVVALVVALVAAGCGSASTSTSGVEPAPAAARPGRVVSAGATSSASAWHGLVPTVERRRPVFTLADTSGRRFAFAAATAGSPTLLFFGYTHCPDLCPTTMADIAAAMREVGPALRARTRVVFVTTDPRRDTAPVIRRWLDQFDRSFIGLTGTPAHIAAAQRAAGIPLAHVAAGPGNYPVSHAAQVAAYGADNENHVLYFANARVSDYAADLPRLSTL
jgi:protein SCO1